MAFMRYTRKADTRVVHACTHNLADIPNGVAVCVADLQPGGVLREGSVIAPDEAGLYHLVKTAKVVEAAATTATEIKVEKGHHFKVGDFAMAKVGGKAYAITAVDTTSPTFDKITVGTALGVAFKVGDALQQAKAESTGTASAFKYEAAGFAVVGDSFDVEALTNTVVPAVTFGQFKAAVSPAISADLRAALPTIRFI